MRRDDEYRVAAACHAINALPVWGLIFSGWVWFANREKSRYIVAQSRQAMYFHGLLLFGILVWMAVKLITLILDILFAPLGLLLNGVNIVIITLLSICYVAVCFWGAYRCWDGQPFRYPLIEDRTND